MQRERLKLEGEEILSTLRRIQLQLECAQSAFEDVTDEKPHRQLYLRNHCLAEEI